MKKHKIKILVILFISFLGCKTNFQEKEYKTRQVIDSVGFAKYNWQMDSLMKQLSISKITNKTWRVAITPHDDYAYVKDLYPNVLGGIKAKTVVLIGVAHKARDFDLEDKIIFDSFENWSAPYGNVRISELRNELINELGDSLCIVHNEMHSIEHSLEALIPFLQFKNPEIEIIPILVPYMDYNTINKIATPLANILSGKMYERNLHWGKDLAVVISTDAVHYGDEDWGGKNYAQFGVDSLGWVQAKNHEMEIISNCLVDEITKDKVQKFINYTVQEVDYKEYKWPWCGRYSVPFGLVLSKEMEKARDAKVLIGEFIEYSNSIDGKKLDLTDIHMGVTAPASYRHWVGYATVGYE